MEVSDGCRMNSGERKMFKNNVEVEWWEEGKNNTHSQ